MNEIIDNFKEVTGLSRTITPVGNQVLVQVECVKFPTLSLLSEKPASFNIASITLLGAGNNHMKLPLNCKLMLSGDFYEEVMFKFMIKDVPNDKGIKNIVDFAKSLKRSEYEEFLKSKSEVNFIEFLIIPDYYIVGYYHD
jgi:hypothetical protein